MDSKEDGIEGKEMSKYPDLVKRLRENGTWTSDKVWESHPDCAEAADAIEHLMNEIDFLDEDWRKDKKRIEELEAALKPFADASDLHLGSDDMSIAFRIIIGNLRQARKVLGEKK
jgi:hypothetical protein